MRKVTDKEMKKYKQLCTNSFASSKLRHEKPKKSKEEKLEERRQKLRYLALRKKNKGKEVNPAKSSKV